MAHLIHTIGSKSGGSPPTQPIVSSSTITTSGFTISWTGGTGATSYTYTLNGNSSTPSSSTTSSAVFSGLNASTTYAVIVTAVNSAASVASASLNVTTLLSAPTQPVLSSSSITTSGFTISWTGGTGATSYTYKLNGSPATPGSSTTSSAVFSGLVSSTTYAVIVTAVNSSASVASASVNVTTLLVSPTQPTGLASSSITSTSFTISWTGGTRATSYTYTLNGTTKTGSSSTSSPTTFTGLNASTTYAVVVTAVNSGGSIASASLNVTTLLAAPTQPTGLSSSSITTTSFAISWTGGTGATSYTYTLNGTAKTGSSSTSSPATFSALVAGTTYAVIVTAVNSGGSIASASLNVTTLLAAPTQPTSFSFVTITASSFTLYWLGGSGATSYTYTLNGNTTSGSSSTSSPTTFTNLLPGTTYSVIVTAVNSAGSINSASSNVTTSAGVIKLSSTVPSITVAYPLCGGFSDRVYSLDLAGNFLLINTTVRDSYTITPLNMGFSVMKGFSYNAVLGCLMIVANNYIYTCSLTTYELTIVAGKGTPATLRSTIVNGTGTAASFYYPTYCAVDSAGNTYIVEAGSTRIRKMTKTFVVTTFIATLSYFPGLIALDINNNLFIGNGSFVSKYNSSGVFVINYSGFNTAVGVVCDSVGNVIVSDVGTHILKIISTTGTISVYSGSSGTIGSTNSTLALSRFNKPVGVALSLDQKSVYVLEDGAFDIRMVAYPP